jgi:hypothetical protein
VGGQESLVDNFRLLNSTTFNGQMHYIQQLQSSLNVALTELTAQRNEIKLLQLSFLNRNDNSPPTQTVPQFNNNKATSPMSNALPSYFYKSPPTAQNNGDKKYKKQVSDVVYTDDFEDDNNSDNNDIKYCSKETTTIESDVESMTLSTVNSVDYSNTRVNNSLIFKDIEDKYNIRKIINKYNKDDDGNDDDDDDDDRSTIVSDYNNRKNINRCLRAQQNAKSPLNQRNENFELMREK